MRKAQAQHALYYVFALVIIGVLILIGYTSVTQVQVRGNEAGLLQFETQLKTDVETIRTRYGAFKENSYPLPASYRELCFVDISKRTQLKQSYNLQHKYLPIYDSVVSKNPNNAFLIGFDLRTYNLGPLQLDAYPYYKCFQNNNGNVKLALKGLGKKTGIYTDFITKAQVDPIKETSLKSPDERITLTIPPALLSGSIPVKELSIRLIPNPNNPFQSETYKFLAKDETGNELHDDFTPKIPLACVVKRV